MDGPACEEWGAGYDVDTGAAKGRLRTDDQAVRFVEVIMANIAKRPVGRWRARYRDEAEHSRHFARKVDAQRWIDEVTASIVTGQYVDPRAGRITFQEYAEGWGCEDEPACRPGSVLACLAARDGRPSI